MNMKKKQNYMKPSLRVAELEQCEALLQGSGDQTYRPDYGDAIEETWGDDD
jgi:hypothetical protein